MPKGYTKIPREQRHRPHGCSLWCHHCVVCMDPIPYSANSNRKTCSDRCRQRLHRSYQKP